MSAPTAQFCRLTVAYDDGRVDLAVPARVPLRLVLSAIVDAAGVSLDGATAWVLRTINGVEISLDESIGDAGIEAGAIVVLCRRTEAVTPPLYDDIVEAFDRLPATAWSAADTRRTAVVASAILSLLSATALVRWDSPVAAGVIGIAIGVVLLAGAVIGVRVIWARPASPTATLACGWMGVGAFWCAGTHPTALRLLVVSVLLLGLAAVLYAVVRVPVLLGVLAGVGGLGCASCLLHLLTQAGIGQVSAAAAALSLAALPLLPRSSLWLARVPQPVATAESVRDLDARARAEMLPALVEDARRYLIGLSTGVLVVVTASASFLAATGDGYGAVLAAVAGLVVLLRARHQPIRQLWVMAVSCCGAVSSVLAWRLVVAIDAVALPVLAVAGMVAATAALALAARRTVARRSVRLDGWLDRLQTALALSVVPLVLAVWDVYRALRALAA